jgi:hypothetical protein
MNQIKFVQDWNGKITGGCKLFTTIRREPIHKGYAKTATRKNYYNNSRVGEEFEVVLKGKIIGLAILREVYVRKFSELDGFTLMTDTGFTDLDYIKKLFKNFGVIGEDTVLVLVFEKVGEDK